MIAAVGQPEAHSDPRFGSHFSRGSMTTARARTSSVVGFDVDKADPGMLCLRWRQFHDQRARAALVERFLPLARSLARRYASSSVPLEDLVQVASFGLLKA